MTSKYRILCLLNASQISSLLLSLLPVPRLPLFLPAPSCSPSFPDHVLWWSWLLVTNSQSSSTYGYLEGSFFFPRPKNKQTKKTRGHVTRHGQWNKSRSDEALLLSGSLWVEGCGPPSSLTRPSTDLVWAIEFWSCRQGITETILRAVCLTTPPPLCSAVGIVCKCDEVHCLSPFHDSSAPSGDGLFGFTVAIPALPHQTDCLAHLGPLPTLYLHSYSGGAQLPVYREHPTLLLTSWLSICCYSLGPECFSFVLPSTWLIPSFGFGSAVLSAGSPRWPPVWIRCCLWGSHSHGAPQVTILITLEGP